MRLTVPTILIKSFLDRSSNFLGKTRANEKAQFLDRYSKRRENTRFVGKRTPNEHHETRRRSRKADAR